MQCVIFERKSDGLCEEDSVSMFKSLSGIGDSGLVTQRGLRFRVSVWALGFQVGVFGVHG